MRISPFGAIKVGSLLGISEYHDLYGDIRHDYNFLFNPLYRAFNPSSYFKISKLRINSLVFNVILCAILMIPLIHLPVYMVGISCVILLLLVFGRCNSSYDIIMQMMKYLKDMYPDRFIPGSVDNTKLEDCDYYDELFTIGYYYNRYRLASMLLILQRSRKFKITDIDAFIQAGVKLDQEVLKTSEILESKLYKYRRHDIIAYFNYMKNNPSSPVSFMSRIPI